MIKRLLLLLCLLVTAGSAAWAEIASGSCQNGTWVIDDNGKLTVNINGKMKDYGEGKAPWYGYADQITAIHIGSGCKNVGRNGFFGLKCVSKVTGGENVEAVAMYAFESCGDYYYPIPSIYFPKCSYVGESAFLNASIRTISLPLVKTWKEKAMSEFAKITDLGDKVEWLEAGSVIGPDYVIIQNPTPPDWTRLYKDQPLIGHSIDYPFGENSNAKVIVPQQFLKTYQDFYTANHPEVQWGYMSAYYDRGWQKSTGFIVGGGPIYSEDGLIGCWYVRNGRLRVIYNVCTIPVYGEGEAPWNSVLGEVEYMDITVLDAFLNIPDDAFNGGSNIRGIKSIVLSFTRKYNDRYGYLYAEGTHRLNIGNRSFKDCRDLQSINHSTSRIDGECTIGDYAFQGSANLEYINDFVVNKLGKGAFMNCQNLQELSVVTPPWFIDVPDYAFLGCKKLELLNGRIKNIGKQAFSEAGMSEVHIINQDVGEGAFANSGVKTIYIGQSAVFSSKCFAGCTSLSDIYVSPESGNEDYPSDMFSGVDISNVTLHCDADAYYSKFENHELFGKMKADKNYSDVYSGSIGDCKWTFSKVTGTLAITGSIPDFATDDLPEWMFVREVVTNVVLENCDQIGANAFKDFSALTTFIVPRECKTIGDNAFKDCINLDNININKVEILGNNVFENCTSLYEVDLDKNLKKAGDYIFKHCTNLHYIDNKDNTPAEVTDYTFAEIGSDAYQLRGGKRKAVSGQAAVTLEVPDEFVTNYIIDPNWGKFHIKFADGRGTWEHAGRFGDGTWILYDDSTMVVAAEKATGVDYVNFPTEIYKMTKRIEISGSITSLGDCFKYFENLESVSLCPSIKALNGTFYYCSKLWEINLGNVETIGDDTFINCGMTGIDLSNVKNVGKDAFESCQKLVYAKLGSSCAVDKRVFSKCSALSLVDLGNANLDNAVGCFNACDNLKTIAYNGQNLPKGIFSGCTALEEVRLGSRVRSIQWSAFEGCTALRTIYCDSPMPPSLPVEKTQDIIGYEGTGDVQTPILGPEYDVWAFHDLDRPSIKLYVHPDCVPVYRRFDVWKEMDIQGNAEDVEPLLPTGGSLRGSGKDENGAPVISGSTWYLDEEGKMTFDALGNIAARTSDGNYWWSVFDSYLPFIATVEVTDDVTGVPNNMFGWMDSDRLTRGITTVILGEGLKKAGYDSFHFSGIKDVYLYAENLILFHPNSFNRDAAAANNATLHVLKDDEDKYLNFYKTLPATKDFHIVADLDPRHPKVKAVNFDFAEVTLRPGEQLQLEPRFTPADVENKKLRYEDVSGGHHVYIDNDNDIIFAQSEGVAYIQAYSSYTVSGEEVMALWGPTQEIYLKVTITEPEPGEEIFFDYREGEGTDAPTITCHVLRDEQLDVDTWIKTCEIAGPYNEDDITTQAIPEWRTGTVNIPEEAMGYEVVRVGAYAFYERQISTLYIPWTVTQIGYNACSYCDYLTDVYIYSFKPLRLTDAYGEEDENLWNNDAFYRIGEGDDGEGFATLHVPAGSKAAWDIYPWNEWFRYIVEDAPIPDGIKEIQNSKFKIQNEGTWYDLSGRKIVNGKLHRGIYINGGKKVVIK